MDGSTTVGSTRTITCSSDYAVNPSATTQTITCQADGTWTMPGVPPCLRDCKTPANPTGGTYPMAGSTTVGSAKTITCSPDYAVNPSATTQTIKCQAGGTWTVPGVPPCLRDCGVPTNPTGGIYPAAGATTEGSTKRISCSAGYAVNPSGTTPTITCQAGGSWTAPSIPPCLRKFCQNNINMTLHHPPLAHDHTRV
ncbi:sushi, von Willebrand factor type A, EGF and pentraxin domain-containing protein 1-like [Sycon ciliatum]|uniref:sushi, von Willebrand factor type A, EGF and pentraxin domain-containing protein 1-like n=1 Tax=Sycon ciliatum TaxID=27933 RepID=UPI0031F6784A